MTFCVLGVLLSIYNVPMEARMDARMFTRPHFFGASPVGKLQHRASVYHCPWSRQRRTELEQGNVSTDHAQRQYLVQNTDHSARSLCLSINCKFNGCWVLTVVSKADIKWLDFQSTMASGVMGSAVIEHTIVKKWSSIKRSPGQNCLLEQNLYNCCPRRTTGDQSRCES
jgi:hypothetical protein